MGFRNSTSCMCCAEEPCECICPTGTPSELLIEIDGFSADTEYDCNACDWLNGSFSLAADSGDTQIDALFPCSFQNENGRHFCTTSNPDIPIWDRESTYIYVSDWVERYCGMYEPIANSRFMIGAKWFCAYQKDGVTYAKKVEGSTYVGRGLAVRIGLLGWLTGIYAPSYCEYADMYTPENGYITSFFLCSLIQSLIQQQVGGASYDPLALLYCCPETYKSDIYNTWYDCDQTIAPFGYCKDNPYAINDFSGGYVFYGQWQWMSIFSPGSLCRTFTETLSLLSYELKTGPDDVMGSWRKRRNWGDDKCSVIEQLCRPPGIIRVEGI